MQCALTTSPATQRVHARRSGRQALRVHATAQTSTGLPKPKWAGGPGAGQRAGRRRDGGGYRRTLMPPLISSLFGGLLLHHAFQSTP